MNKKIYFIIFASFCIFLSNTNLCISAEEPTDPWRIGQPSSYDYGGVSTIRPDGGDSSSPSAAEPAEPAAQAQHVPFHNPFAPPRHEVAAKSAAAGTSSPPPPMQQFPGGTAGEAGSSSLPFTVIRPGDASFSLAPSSRRVFGDPAAVGEDNTVSKENPFGSSVTGGRKGASGSGYPEMAAVLSPPKAPLASKTPPQAKDPGRRSGDRSAFKKFCDNYDLTDEQTDILRDLIAKSGSQKSGYLANLRELIATNKLSLDAVLAHAHWLSKLVFVTAAGARNKQALLILFRKLVSCPPHQQETALETLRDMYAREIEVGAHVKVSGLTDSLQIILESIISSNVAAIVAVAPPATPSSAASSAGDNPDEEEEDIPTYEDDGEGWDPYSD